MVERNRVRNRRVEIFLNRVLLDGDLAVPKGAQGIVIFAHGSGSSRNSPRNRYVAERLHEYRIGTLLFDLLTEYEDQDYLRRFDIDLLTRRLVDVTDWLRHEPEAASLPLGYFGASTGAAAALKAAAIEGEGIRAVVSRGGRPDLAGDDLYNVISPTLLIVGGSDAVEVLSLNEEAFARLAGIKRYEIVAGAGHLFEEQGKLDVVVSLAANWFQRYLQPPELEGRAL